MKSLDDSTLKALHIDEIYALVKPFSELGKKAKREMIVYKAGDEVHLSEYYALLDTLIKSVKQNSEIVHTIGSSLSHFEDIRHSIASASQRCLEMHELYEIKHFIYYYRAFMAVLKRYEINVISETKDFTPLFSLLDKDTQGSASFYLSETYSERFSALKSELSKLESEISQRLAVYTEEIKNAMGLARLEPIITVSRLRKDDIDKLLNSPYFVVENENFANITLKIRKPAEILEIEQRVAECKAELEVEAGVIRQMLTSEIAKYQDDLLVALESVGWFDLLFAKAVFGVQNNCVAEIGSRNSDLGLVFKGEGVFNLFIKSELEKIGIPYQKIDISISDKVNLITGSNMGGKSSMLKTIGQIAILTKMAMPVPAEQVSLTLFDNVFYSGAITTEDRADLSSFGFEVFTLQNVIKTAGKTLFLLDEFGRGTNTTEGMALFQSVLEYFSQRADTVLIAATHYPPPKDNLSFTHFQMKGLDTNFIQTVGEQALAEKLKLLHKYMNYQPVKVSADATVPKSALQIAELLGLETEIVKLAKKKLDKSFIK